MSGIPSWCRAGQRVICVDTASIDGGAFYLTAGRLYTIQSVNNPWLRVFDDRGVNCGWHYSHFRPLVDDANDAETEREIYRKKVHQNAAPRKVSERA